MGENNTEKITGLVHQTESFGAVDGPGIRFIVFMQGCRYRCRYCHNPETWALTGGEERTPEDVLEQALRYKAYWRQNGGITVSGGEGMLQIDFVTRLFELAKDLNIAKTAGSDRAGALAGLLRKLGGVLGILTGDAEAYVKGGDSASDDLDTAKIEELIQIRAAARKNKNWAEADRARNELQAMGILIEDGPSGTTWRRKD